MNTPKTLAIEIVTIKRTRKRIEIAWHQGDASFGLKERDNPLPSFVAAFDALAPLVATVCHFPPDYAAINLRVVGLTLGEQGGSQTAALVARKGIDDASQEFVFNTPPRLLADPSEEGSYTPPLDPANAELVATLVEEAKRYIRGERAQGQIEFESGAEQEGDDSEDDGDDHEADELPLPLAAPDMPHNAERVAEAAAGNPKRRKRGGDVVPMEAAGQ